MVLTVILLGCTYTAFARSTVANTDELGDVIPRLSHKVVTAIQVLLERRNAGLVVVDVTGGFPLV